MQRGIFQEKDSQIIIIGEYYKIFNYLYFTDGIMFSPHNGYKTEKIIKYNKIISINSLHKLIDTYVRTILINKLNTSVKLSKEKQEIFINIVWNKEFVNNLNVYFALERGRFDPIYVLGTKEENKIIGLFICDDKISIGIHRVCHFIDNFEILEPVMFCEDAKRVSHLNKRYYWSCKIPKEIRDTIDEIVEPLEA